MQSFLGLLTKAGAPKAPVKLPMGDLPPVLDVSQDSLLIPSLKDLGYVGEKTSFIQGGETNGLEILKKYLANTKKTLEFEKPKTNPAALKPDTTYLSPYLKFGCVSARHFYAEVDEVYKKAKGKHSKPPVSLLGKNLSITEYMIE